MIAFNPQVKITPAIIQKHLGANSLDDEFYHKEPMIGVALGMAYTQFGGDILAVETNLIESGKHKLVLTGKLGEVMKESAQAALSYIRARVDEFGIDPERLAELEFHIHVPAGAIPKDGPSAGITMATSMLSALLNRAPIEKTAMTGEITLHGKVLAIGGLKEKVLAAQREGLTRVIVPEKNRAAFAELPASARRRVKAEFVRDYSDVFSIVFGERNEAGHVLSVAEDAQDLAS